LGNALQAQGKTADAEQTYRHALELQKDILATVPEVPASREELVRTLNNLAVLLSGSDRRPEAEQSFLEAHEHWRKLAADSPAEPEFQHRLAASYGNLAGLWQELNHLDKAQEALAEAVAIAQKIAGQFPDSANYSEQLARSLNNLGVLQRQKRNPTDATEAIKKSRELWHSLVLKYPNVPDYQDELARALSNLAPMLVGLEAEEAHNRTVEIRTKLAGRFSDVRPYQEDLARSLGELGNFLKNAGKVREAADAFRNASQNWHALATSSPGSISYLKNLADTSNNLGIALAGTGRPDDAELAYRKALWAMGQLPDEVAARPEHRESFAKVHQNIGLLIGTRQLDEAEASLRFARTTFTELLSTSPDSPGLRHSLAAADSALGNVLAARDRLEEAEPLFRESLILRQELARQFPTMPAVQNTFAWFLATCPDSRFRDPDRAISAAERAVQLAPRDGKFWNTVGVARYRVGNWKQAIDALNKSIELRGTADAIDWFFLSMAHSQLGDKGDAQSHYEQARQWVRDNKPHDEELNRFHTEAELLLETK
jgi:tetratricopeptide (TPR) repeat protein